jgi:hypothetical protein
MLFLLLQINEDITALIKTLVPLKYLSTSQISEGSSLDKSLIERLTAKVRSILSSIYIH